MRKCTKCKETKSLDLFSKELRVRDGCKAICTLCTRECMRKYYSENKEKEDKRKSNWRKNNPEVLRASNRKAYYKTVYSEAGPVMQALNDLKKELKQHE